MVEITKIIEILTPALSALVGGLIVILGNIVIHNLQKESTNRIFLSEQIERIYQHSLESIEWLKKQQVEIAYYLDNSTSIKLQDKEQRSSEIKMLVNLYFPKLVHHCEELDRYEKLYYKGIALGYRKPEEFDASELKSSIFSSSEFLFLTHANLRGSLHKEMNKLLSKS